MKVLEMEIHLENIGWRRNSLFSMPSLPCFVRFCFYMAGVYILSVTFLVKEMFKIGTYFFFHFAGQPHRREVVTFKKCVIFLCK